MTPFQTHLIMTDISGRRFSQLPLGGDKVSLVREEHSRLMHLASAVIGVEPEAVTYELVAAAAQVAIDKRAGVVPAVTGPLANP